MTRKGDSTRWLWIALDRLREGLAYQRRDGVRRQQIELVDLNMHNRVHQAILVDILVEDTVRVIPKWTYRSACQEYGIRINGSGVEGKFSVAKDRHRQHPVPLQIDRIHWIVRVDVNLYGDHAVHDQVDGSGVVAQVRIGILRIERLD